MRTATCPEHGKQLHDINGRCQLCEYSRVIGKKLVPVKDPATKRTIYQVAS